MLMLQSTAFRNGTNGLGENENVTLRMDQMFIPETVESVDDNNGDEREQNENRQCVPLNTEISNEQLSKRHVPKLQLRMTSERQSIDIGVETVFSTTSDSPEPPPELQRIERNQVEQSENAHNEEPKMKGNVPEGNTFEALEAICIPFSYLRILYCFQLLP